MNLVPPVAGMAGAVALGYGWLWQEGDCSSAVLSGIVVLVCNWLRRSV